MGTTVEPVRDVDRGSAMTRIITGCDAVHPDRRGGQHAKEAT